VKKENFSGAYEVLGWLDCIQRIGCRQKRIFQIALSGEKEFDTEFRVVWPDKTVHFIKARAMVQRDQGRQCI
jgi:hypothetical protein